MFDLMYEANGIGLAANQVGLPLRLFVINLAGKRGDGEELVFLNPVVSRPKGTSSAEEGCLSLPGVYGEVVRPKQVTVDAYDLQGRQFQGEIDGLLARCVQHELDHLDGVLFIDRLTESGKQAIVPELEEFLIDFDSRRKTGSLPDDVQIDQYCQELQRRYCGQS